MFGFGKKDKKTDFDAVINDGAAKITVKKGDNLLKTALDAGLPWPHDCRVGSCGTCKCVVKSGKIKALTDFSYVLDGEQLKSGMVLACQTLLKTDIEVEVEMEISDQPAIKIHHLAGKISSIRDLTHDIKELTIKTEDQFDRDMVAGQYAEIEVDGVSSPRSYSFAKSPENENSGEFSFYIRKVPGGKFTEWLFGEDRTGTDVKLSAPYGHFYYRSDSTYMVCIAGGSGMSAVKAVLEDCVREQVQRNCIFLFGAQTEKDLYCQDEMQIIKEKWNPNFTFDYVEVLSNLEEGHSWTGPTGFVTEHLKQAYMETGSIDLNGAHGYLCGPPPMIDSAIELLKSGGIKEGDIYFDKFLDASNIPGGR
ncbi:MAG: 2Fe-2S iron-sulfur cluster binding domain-containing protein [Pseudomonadota bacterium]